MKAFLLRFGAMISLVLSGFDRLRFRGESRVLNNVRGVDSYLYQEKIRYVDFPKHCEELTHLLRRRTEDDARQRGVPVKPLNSPKIDKEATALELASKHSCPGGRLAVLSCVEECRTYRLRKNADGMVYPVKEIAKCVHYYHYFQHAEFGLCYVRVQSWFPFTIRVGMNGREWLYQQLRQRGVHFQHRGNLLVSVEDADLAQQLLDEQIHANYAQLLSGLVQPVQPLWHYLHEQVTKPYYWTAEQTEWANDFVFRTPEDLARWYKRWLRHGIETLQCADVLRYMGRKQPHNCSNEAKIDLRRRPEGARLKFWYDSNSLKMYDKEAIAFRPETTINQPAPFRVYRLKEGETQGEPQWRQMRKGVADMDRRAEISQAANNRLLESLATVAETQPLGELLKPLGQPVVEAGKRRARALNPLTGNDGQLLRLLGQGNFLIQGFRNADVREGLYGATADVKERQQQAAAVTRRLALLRAHGLIVRVQNSHRYHLSASGRRIVTALLAAHASDVNRLAQCA